MRWLTALPTRLRRWVGTRNEWAVRLLGLSRLDADPGAPGLLMVQVDGLSYEQLQVALRRKEMPFVSRLLGEGHQLQRLYSGLPSSTPAFQGELFYGVPGAVPAFGFKEHASGEIVKMYEPRAAARVEQALSGRGEPLLREGSVYAGIYTGGARESHFCAASLGWDAVLDDVKPLAFVVLGFVNVLSVVRALILMGLEAILAVADCIRGIIAGRDLLKELTFVPARVGVCILLRELSRIGVEIDIVRGLRAIHVNFLGYDEQAHRRGPDSRFAHWTLKGIDDAIARVWRAAGRSAGRDYQLWIFSDHGQENTTPFVRSRGVPLSDAVTAVFESAGASGSTTARPCADEIRSVQSHRAQLLGGRHIQRLFRLPTAAQAWVTPAPPQVVAVGPVGFIYRNEHTAILDESAIGHALVRDAGIPMVLARAGPGSVKVWDSAGEHRLPADRGSVLGANHPFLDEACADLISLCWHEDAGEFVICGWSIHTPALSFPKENGAHAGPGPIETSAFALLPPAAVARMPMGEVLRPSALRNVAFAVMEPDRFPVAVDSPPSSSAA